MKPLHHLCAGFALLLAFGACSRDRTYPDYSVSSGFMLDSPGARDPQVADKLAALRRNLAPPRLTQKNGGPQRCGIKAI